MNLDMERQIHEIEAVCDYVQATLRSPETIVVVVRRMECLVPRPRRPLCQWQSGVRSAFTRRAIQSRRRMLVGGFLNTLLRCLAETSPLTRLVLLYWCPSSCARASRRHTGWISSALAPAMDDGAGGVSVGRRIYRFIDRLTAKPQEHSSRQRALHHAVADIHAVS